MTTTTTWGGFIKENIRLWILKECLQSGDPENFLSALRDGIDDITDEIFEYLPDESLYWEKISGEIDG